MKIALCRVQARLAMIVVTAPRAKASAFFFSCASAGSSLVLLYGPGVSGQPGTGIHTPPCMSVKSANGSCLEAYSGLLLDGQLSASGSDPGSACMYASHR